MAFDVVFCGTPQFAVPTLEKLFESFNVQLVVTQPDRPKGRGNTMASSPVKETALGIGLPVFQPDRIRRPEVVQQLAAMKHRRPGQRLSSFRPALAEATLELDDIHIGRRIVTPTQRPRRSSGARESLSLQ